MEHTDRVIFVSHPYAWRSQYPGRGEQVVYAGLTARQLVEMENAVAARWLEAVAHAGPRTAIVINGYSNDPAVRESQMGPLLEVVRRCMPGRSLITMHDANEAMGRHIVEHFRSTGRPIDDRTAWEAWGQSTEGCVPNWAGHIAAGAGVGRGIAMEYEMTFPDAAFAMTATFLKRKRIGDTDVCGYLSRAKDGELFAIYFAGVIHDFEAPRHVLLPAGTTAVHFTDKLGGPVELPHTAGCFRVPLGVAPVKPVYIRAGRAVTLEQFEGLLDAATVG